MHLYVSLLFMYSQRVSAWPVYISLANHTAESRNVAAGKRLIALIDLPKKRATDSQEDFLYCASTIVQAWWRHMLLLIYRHRHGFLFQLFGDSFLSHIVPRLGPVLCDLLEGRLTAGIINCHSLRCLYQLDTDDADEASALHPDGTGQSVPTAPSASAPSSSASAAVALPPDEPHDLDVSVYDCIWV
jgi:hypothetical protein